MVEKELSVTSFLSLWWSLVPGGIFEELYQSIKPHEAVCRTNPSRLKASGRERQVVWTSMRLVLPECSRWKSFLVSHQLLLVAGDPWHSWACRWIIPVSASAVTWPSPCVSSELPTSSKDTSYWIRAPPHPGCPFLSLIISAKILFLNQATCTGSRSQDVNMPFGGRNSYTHYQNISKTTGLGI